MVSGRTGTVNALADVDEVFAPALARLQLDAEAHFGAGSLRLLPAGRQHRPFSDLLRVAVLVQSSDTPIAHLFVKVFKPNARGEDAMRVRVAGDFEMNRRVYASMRPHPEIGAVPPVACYPDLLTTVTEEVAGPTLLDCLQKDAAWFPDERRLTTLARTLTTAGTWIRAFQTIDDEAARQNGEAAATARRVSMPELRAYIDHRLQQLVAVGAATFREHDRYRVLRHIERLGHEIDPADLRRVPVHADLALGNIIVAGSRVVVLDFAMASTGTKFQDVTRLWLQLDLLAVKPHITHAVVRRLQDALLEGFDPRLEVADPLFRLLVLLHRVNHLTTLTVKRTSLVEATYNSLVRRQHRRWMASELAESESAATA